MTAADGEDVLARGRIAEIRRRHADVAEIGHGIVASTHRDQSVGMRNAAGIQQHRVGDGEDRDVGADAQGQRQHRDGGEAGRLAQLTQRVTKFV